MSLVTRLLTSEPDPALLERSRVVSALESEMDEIHRLVPGTRVVTSLLNIDAGGTPAIFLVRGDWLRREQLFRYFCGERGIYSAKPVLQEWADSFVERHGLPAERKDYRRFLGMYL